MGNGIDTTKPAPAQTSPDTPPPAPPTAPDKPAPVANAGETNPTPSPTSPNGGDNGSAGPNLTLPDGTQVNGDSVDLYNQLSAQDQSSTQSTSDNRFSRLDSLNSQSTQSGEQTVPTQTQQQVQQIIQQEMAKANQCQPAAEAMCKDEYQTHQDNKAKASKDALATLEGRYVDRSKSRPTTSAQAGNHQEGGSGKDGKHTAHLEAKKDIARDEAGRGEKTKTASNLASNKKPASPVKPSGKEGVLAKKAAAEKKGDAKPGAEGKQKSLAFAKKGTPTSTHSEAKPEHAEGHGEVVAEVASPETQTNLGKKTGKAEEPQTAQHTAAGRVGAQASVDRSEKKAEKEDARTKKIRLATKRLAEAKDAPATEAMVCSAKDVAERDYRDTHKDEFSNLCSGRNISGVLTHDSELQEQALACSASSTPTKTLDIAAAVPGTDEHDRLRGALSKITDLGPKTFIPDKFRVLSFWEPYSQRKDKGEIFGSDLQRCQESQLYVG